MLGAQSANLPRTSFVPGGDKGTDFPIMNRLGAVLRKLFFTLHSSKKKKEKPSRVKNQFCFGRNTGGGRGRSFTHNNRCSSREIKQSSTWLAITGSRCCLTQKALPPHTRPRFFSVVPQRVYLCFPCKLDRCGLVSPADQREMEAERSGILTPPRSLTLLLPSDCDSHGCWPLRMDPGAGAVATKTVRVLPARSWPELPHAGVSVGSRGIQTMNLL